MSSERAARLEEIAREIEHLEVSPLYKYRLANGYSPVIGEGDPHAPIMFIGEAPGQREAETGRPFVGAAGRVLDELLGSIGLARIAELERMVGRLTMELEIAKKASSLLDGMRGRNGQQP